MVCVQPAKQKRAKRLRVKHSVRWLVVDTSSHYGSTVASALRPASRVVKPATTAVGKRQDPTSDRDEQKEKGLSPPLVSSKSCLVDIDVSILESAMTAVLVALHGGIGDVGLALKEEVRLCF